MGVRKVNWQGLKDRISVSLSNTLVATETKTSLLSVPTLVSKNIGVLFIPGKAMFLDVLDKNNILGYANQKTDGLFYISDKQDKDNVETSDDETSVRTMMATASQ